MTIPDGAADFNSGGEDSGQGSSDGSGVNPAWNDVLGIVPQELHSQVTPHLRNWDQGVQHKIQQVQSDWAPFNEFKEAGVSPEHLRMGLGILQAIESDPKQVYDLLAQQLNISAEPGQGETEQKLSEEFQALPQEVQDKLQMFDAMQKQLDTVTQWASTQQQNWTQQQSQQQEDHALEETMSGLKSKYGNFDEHYVLSQMLSGAKPDDAVKAYQSLVEQITTEAQRPKAPKILGSGSIVPGETGLDPRKMDGKQTKDLVAQMLAQAAAQNH